MIHEHDATESTTRLPLRSTKVMNILAVSQITYSSRYHVREGLLPSWPSNVRGWNCLSPPSDRGWNVPQDRIPRNRRPTLTRLRRLSQRKVFRDDLSWLYRICPGTLIAPKAWVSLRTLAPHRNWEGLPSCGMSLRTR